MNPFPPKSDFSENISLFKGSPLNISQHLIYQNQQSLNLISHGFNKQYNNKLQINKRLLNNITKGKKTKPKLLHTTNTKSNRIPKYTNTFTYWISKYQRSK